MEFFEFDGCLPDPELLVSGCELVSYWFPGNSRSALESHYSRRFCSFQGSVWTDQIILRVSNEILFLGIHVSWNLE
jgi:hypothetical protein